MSSMADVLEKLVEQGLNVARPAGNRFYMVAGGICLAAGAGFVLAAIYTWTREYYTPELAAIVTGAAVLGLGMIFILLGILQQVRERMILEEIRNHAVKALSVTYKTIEEELEEPVRNNPVSAVLLATVAGLVAGEKLLHPQTLRRF